MKIHVLGPGCMKCVKLYDEVQKVLESAKINAQVEKVEKIDEIMKFAVAMTPALVIDGEVKCAGRVPTRSEIEEWVSKKS